MSPLPSNSDEIPDYLELPIEPPRGITKTELAQSKGADAAEAYWRREGGNAAVSDAIASVEAEQRHAAAIASMPFPGIPDELHQRDLGWADARLRHAWRDGFLDRRNELAHMAIESHYKRHDVGLPAPSDGSAAQALEVASARADLVSHIETAQAASDLSQARATRVTYGTAWRSFTEYCEKIGILDPMAVAGRESPTAEEMIIAWLGSLYDSTKGTTLRTYSNGVLYAFQRAGIDVSREKHVFINGRQTSIKEIVIGANRVQDAEGHLDETRMVQHAAPLGYEGLQDLLDVQKDDIRGIRNRAILLLGFGGGLRRSELSHARLIDIHFYEDEQGGLAVKLPFSKTDQEGKTDSVFIAEPFDPNDPDRPFDWFFDVPSAVREWIAVRGSEAGSLFTPLTKAGNPRRKGGRLMPLSGRSIAYILDEAVRNAGLRTPPQYRSYSPHSLRTGVATALYKRGVDLESIRQQLRHSNMKTTEGYVRGLNAREKGVFGRNRSS